MSDNFESVKKGGPIWECKQTGKKKDNTLKALKADDKSWIIGYYLGSEEVSTKNGTSTVHKLKMTKVGDDSHIIGDRDESNEVTIWGTGVLNDQLSKIGIGQLCKVVWEGLQTPKQGSNQYHGWDTLVDKTAEPYSPNTNVGDTTAAPQNEPAQASPAAAPVADEDDDMPF